MTPGKQTKHKARITADLQLRFAGYSDRGRVRAQNEDRWLADVERGIFLVADGMGGGPSGSIAAEIVVQVLPSLLRERLPRTRRFSTPILCAHLR